MIAEKYPFENLYGEFSIRRTFYTAKLPYGEISVQRNFLPQNFLATKFPHSEISYGEIFHGKVSYGEISGHTQILQKEPVF